MIAPESLTRRRVAREDLGPVLLVTPPSLFLLDEDGRRPCFGEVERFRSDPRWRDQLTVPEYFNGDDGAGLGASHQTGWTGLVADLIIRFHGTGALSYRALLGGDQAGT